MISHLDPKHPSMMSELIGRFTTMKVHEVTDGTAPEPNHVYVIPPNRYLSIFQGTFHSTSREATGGTDAHRYFSAFPCRRPGDTAVVVILSGTGTDGTLGLRAVQAAGGVVFVQDPTDAKYDGMPRSAIRTGLADYVLPAHEIPGQLLASPRTDTHQNMSLWKTEGCPRLCKRSLW